MNICVSLSHNRNKSSIRRTVISFYYEWCFAVLNTGIRSLKCLIDMRLILLINFLKHNSVQHPTYRTMFHLIFVIMTIVGQGCAIKIPLTQLKADIHHEPTIYGPIR